MWDCNTILNLGANLNNLFNSSVPCFPFVQKVKKKKKALVSVIAM